MKKRLFLALFVAFYLLRIAYARYETNAKLKADVQKALYIFEDEKLEFDIYFGVSLPKNYNMGFFAI